MYFYNKEMFFIFLSYFYYFCFKTKFWIDRF